MLEKCRPNQFIFLLKETMEIVFVYFLTQLRMIS